VRALIRASRNPMSAEDRLITIFVVTRVLSRNPNIPEAQSFLISALGQANLESHWASEGLRVLGVQKQ